MNLSQEYQRIMRKEFELRCRTLGYAWSDGNMFVNMSSEVRNLTWRIFEVAKSSFVVRSYIERYGLDLADFAHESVAAHTNLVSALVDSALIYEYGPDFGQPGSEWPLTIDGFSYREIMETVRLHDLPENEMGDAPDNGARDEAKKEAEENEYFYSYTESYPVRDTDFKQGVRRLMLAMQDRNSPTGRLLYLADKTAAILATLAYDQRGYSPMMSVGEPSASPRDLEEMKMCDFSTENGLCKASEMWTIDHFHIRRIIDLDDTGFFTAVVVMGTLMTNGRWYDWREKDYLN